jgi:hypothetical protein
MGFQFTELFFAILREYLWDCSFGGLSDFLVRIHEGHRELLCEEGAYGAFS